jgi:aminodeoxyfutalosine synthase
MTTTASVDQALEHIQAGHAPDSQLLAELAASSDILACGALADALRRRIHGTNATFVRVHTIDIGTDEAVPAAAGEVRLAGASPTLDEARARVVAARALAGGRCLSGFSWGDVCRLAEGSTIAAVLATLREAGLDAVAEVTVDTVPSVEAVVTALTAAGFAKLRLHVAKAAAADDRLALWAEVGRVHAATGAVASVAPLPRSLSAFKPTTGYDDVKTVALARLALPDVPHIQVDWVRYGPKLAQVALTFGADDVDDVSASDAAPLGRRRAPLEEIRRNIEAAGFVPVERDGRFDLTRS